jgi:hypothetical protein
MGRSESKDAFNTSKQQSQQDQSNAQAALGSENAAVGDYRNSLNNYMGSMWNTYRPGGEFAQDTTNEVASATQGGQGSLEDYFYNMGKRTGGGTTPQMTASAEEASRASRRDAAQELTQADMQRQAALGHAEEYYTGGLGSIPGMYGSQYASSLGGANSAMGNATNAAQVPGFWDTFGSAFASQLGKGVAGSVTPGGAGAAGAGSCWIAEAIYGIDDARTHLVREWLNREFIRRPVGKLVMALYLRFGRKHQQA